MGDLGPPSDAAAVGMVAPAVVVTNVGDTGVYVPENVSNGIYWTSSSVLTSTVGSGEAGDSTMASGVHSGVVDTSTSDGAGGSDAVNHSRSMSLYF